MFGVLVTSETPQPVFIAAGSREVPVDSAGAGVGTVPATATAVVINLTGVGGTRATYLSLAPAGAARICSTSDLNLAAGTIKANLVTVAIGLGHEVTIFNAAGSIDVVMDVEGYFTPTTAPPRRAPRGRSIR